jgi:ATP-dependent RNA helicase DeaD
MSLALNLVTSNYRVRYEESTPFRKLQFHWQWKEVDLIGQAQTGTGKTAAFGIPLIHKIK